DGQAYRRRVVDLQARGRNSIMPPAPTAATLFAMAAPAGAAAADAAHGVSLAAIVEDPPEGPLAYDPAHPDADPSGYVRYPNVSVTQEMVDLLDARRIYEANATVFQSAKAMLRRSLDIWSSLNDEPERNRIAARHAPPLAGGAPHPGRERQRPPARPRADHCPHAPGARGE